MSFYDAINSGLKFCEGYGNFADPFQYNGVTYKGFFDDTLIDNQLSDGGYVEQLDATLLVRKVSFSNVVVPIDNITNNDQTVTVYNRTYYVKKVKDDRLTYLFYLQDTNR